MNFHSLRFRLIWIHSAAIAILVVCIGFVRYQMIRYRSEQVFDEALSRDARLFVARFQYDGVGFKLSTEGLGTGNVLALQELEHYFVVTNMKGQVLHEALHNRLVRSMLYRGQLTGILRQPSGFSTLKAEDGSVYRFFSLSMNSGIFPEPSLIHLGRSMEPHKGVLREYRAFYIESVPLILAISVGMGWFLAGRALKPFEEITATAEKITFENLNTQIYTEHKEEEIQRLVHSFNAMVRRLDGSFQQMRKFNADAAHELRTPLAILQGETEVALRTPNLPEEIKSVLASNLEELDRLTRLVNDLLILSEAQAGVQILVKEPANVKVLLEDLVDQMRLLAVDRNLLIDLRCSSDIWINADRLWIRRAIINLIHNAIKYSRDGGTIEISAERKSSEVRILIRDHGIGILPQDLPHIFDRLYRADPARSRDSGGVGLGLSLVKWIIEAHTGTVRVESDPGRGSVFEVVLPALSGQTRRVSDSLIGPSDRPEF